jgi:hypothetical protein
VPHSMSVNLDLATLALMSASAEDLLGLSLGVSVIPSFALALIDSLSASAENFLGLISASAWTPNAL